MIILYSVCEKSTCNPFEILKHFFYVMAGVKIQFFTYYPIHSTNICKKV